MNDPQSEQQGIVVSEADFRALMRAISFSLIGLGAIIGAMLGNFLLDGGGMRWFEVATYAIGGIVVLHNARLQGHLVRRYEHCFRR